MPLPLPPKSINGDQVENELYKVFDKFERKLLSDHNEGSPTDFEVRVDGLKVVGRTNKPEEIINAFEFIDFQSSQEVEIRLYQGSSRHNDRHLYILEKNRPRKKEEMTLEGLDSKIQQGVQAAKQQWAHEQMTADLADLRKEHSELEAYTDRIEEELGELRKKKLHLGDVNLAEVGGILLEGFVRRNPSIVARLPGGEALAGAISQDNEERGQEQAVADEYGASISSVEEVNPELLELARNISTKFSKPDFLEILKVLDVLSVKPRQIGPVLKFLEQGQSEENSNTETSQTLM